MTARYAQQLPVNSYVNLKELFGEPDVAQNVIRNEWNADPAFSRRQRREGYELIGGVPVNSSS